MKKIGLLFLLFLLSIFSCTKPNHILTIATAANMQFAMNAISTEFTKQTGIKSNLVIASSGKLTAQIKEGAPYDILVSANMKYPNEIQRSNLAATTPKVYAYGKLVLWSLQKNMVPSIASLSNDDVQHIALANPKTAPYGQAAIDILKHHGIYEQCQNKLVYGESIAQTNQFITSLAAEVGFTAKSVVLSQEMKGKGEWVELDPSTYTRIEQGIVRIKREHELQQEAKAFYDFMFSKDAKKILTEFGYAVDE